MKVSIVGVWQGVDRNANAFVRIAGRLLLRATPFRSGGRYHLLTASFSLTAATCCSVSPIL
jgi:hypothetical protein